MGGNMRLRNKKTGAIYDVFLREREVGGYPCIIVCNKKAYRQSKTKFGVTNYVLDEYSSLTKLNEDWEDVGSTNDTNTPLIKDEKIRKAVRAWAEANDIDRVWHECATCWLRGNGLEIFFEELELEQGNYTITELCGEDEE